MASVKMSTKSSVRVRTGSARYVVVAHPDGSRSKVLAPTKSLTDRIKDEDERRDRR